MMKKILALVLVATLMTFVACDKDNSVSPEAIDGFELLTEIGDEYVSVYTTPSGKSVNTTIDAVFPLLADDDASNDPYIIDYRAADIYAAGHLETAVNISLGDLLARVNDGTVPTDRTILNVCYTGQTASFATALLNLMGYEAQNLKFGMCSVATPECLPGTDKWENAIAEDEFLDALVTEETVATETFDFPEWEADGSDAVSILKSRIEKVGVSGWTIDAATVFSSPEDYFIVNYWPKASYTEPGHIPGAVCFEPKGAFASDARLANLPTDKTIVIYCYTGQTSAQMTAYLRMLGYDAKSLLYGFNGFGFSKVPAAAYHGPANDFCSVVNK